MRSTLPRVIALALLGLLLMLAGPAIAQQSAPGYQVPFVASGETSLTRVPAPTLAEGRSRAATATIVVTYNGFTPEAQAAFQYAVDIWETLIVAPVTIRINANWTPLGPGILGSCGPTQVWRNFSGAPLSNVWYPVALANQLTGSDLNTGNVDMNANFSSSFTWYMGTDGNCPAGQYDLVSVIMHEMGHGLGFLGTAGYSGGYGYIGNDGSFLRYDQLVVNGAGTAITSYTNASTALGSQLVSNNLFFNGANAKAANGGVRPKLYVPTSWNGGSSYAHWDDATYPPGNQNSLMTHAFDSAESIHTPGNMTLGLLKDIGWTAATLTARPDAVIRHISQASYIGDNIYNTTGASQTVSYYAPNSATSTNYIRVYNDGTASDTFHFKGSAGNSNFTVRYYNDFTGTDITSAVTSTNGWNSPSCDVGAYFRVRAEIIPGAAAAYGSALTITMTSTSEANPALSDVVKATTYVRYTQPDLLIRPITSASYIGDNIYNTTGVDQLVNQFVRRNTTCTYYVRLYNDGNTTDNIKVTGYSGAAGYHVQYFDMAATDITASVTGSGWYTGNLSPGGYVYIYFRLTPDSTISEGGIQYIYINGFSVFDATKRDTVRAMTTVTKDQPDGLVKLTTDAAYLGGNLYNTTAVGQSRLKVVDYNELVSFDVLVQNDGNTNDTINVVGYVGSPHWHAHYYDQGTSTEITAAVTGTGWSTGTLAAGASRLIRVTLQPDTDTSLGETQNLMIYLTSVGTAAKRDVVNCAAQMKYFKTDLHIRNLSDVDYIGDGIYNLDGTNQTKSQFVRTNGTVYYMMRVQNDGNTADTFTVTGYPGAAGYHVLYYTGGGTNITTEMTGSGWKSPSLAPGSYTIFYARLTPDSTVPETGAQTLLVTAVSERNAGSKDAVKAITTVAKDQPDGFIHCIADPAYYGVNIYNTTGVNQMVSQYAYTGQPVTFDVYVQNDSNAPDTIKVAAPAGAAAWHVTYYDVSAATDVTAAVVAGTWNTGTLIPGGLKALTITVTPDATVPPKTLLKLPIYLVSIASPTKRDVVEADVVKRYLRPDGQIRNSGETAYDGDNIYNGTGAGQVKAQAVKPTVTATYESIIENDGNNPANFLLLGTIGGSGWAVVYETPDGSGGVLDKTAEMTANGWTVTLNPGQQLQVVAKVTPSFTVPSGQVKNVYITAIAKDDGAMYDTVKAVTTCLAGYRPDLQIRSTAETAYVGNNVYNTDGTGQSSSLTNSSGAGTYYMLIQNDGNASDVFKLTSPASLLLGWTVRYYASGYGEITSDVTGAGWTTGTMSPGTQLGLWVTVSAASSVINGASKTVAVTATSQNDTTQQDVVKSTTRKGLIIILP